MSVVVETLIFCDGSGCALDGPYADGDQRHASAKAQRAGYGPDGWRLIAGKDYCPHCVLKLPIGRVDSGCQRK